MSTIPAIENLRVLPTKRKLDAPDAMFLPRALLEIVFAFPLGIVSALAGAVPVFGSILPISFFFALVCPVVIPLVVVCSVLLGGWLIARAAFRTLICGSALTVTFAKLLVANSGVTLALHVLLHAHEIAFMGLYGAFIILRDSGSAQELPPTAKVPVRPTRTRLFIHDLPKSTMHAFPPTPPFSNPSYTPTRSPTLTESTDMSTPLLTPVDENTFSSLALLSDALDKLGDNELDVVASYVEIIKKGRSNQVLA